MATKNSAPAPAVAPTKGKGKAAPAPAPTVPVAAAPAAPVYVVGPWPAKARGGATVRAYCYAVAVALQQQHPAGFTTLQLASAFAASTKGTTFKQPSGGWGTPAKPNGIARQHANWFAHASQGWLVAPTDAS